MGKDESSKGDGGLLRGRRFSRRVFLKGSAVGAGVAASDLSFLSSLAGAATNSITTENALAGTPASEWFVSAPSSTIEGFATQMSVNAGQRISFKVLSDSSNYQVDIYRIGWYGGAGARKFATVVPSVALPQSQPSPFVDPDSGLVDCGNWAESAFWDVPANATSGVYVANLTRLDGTGQNRIPFVVRNDGRTADVMLQTSDTTWQAYNTWGGYSLYRGAATYGRAVKVSYNRPFNPSEIENTFWYAEIPLIRWLERNGYDISYCAAADVEQSATDLLNKKVFISSGHDEYWSAQQRANVTRARDAGVNLVFMTGNEIFWKTRWESSSAGPSTPYRTLVCYKETLENAKTDPTASWTGTWRDPRFSPPSDGGRPENALTGTLFRAINPTAADDFAISVPAQYGNLRFWRNTSVAGLAAGQTATLAYQTLGYEFDTDSDNGFRPKGLIRLSETTVTANQVLIDFGKTYATLPITHYLTMYRASSGALVWSTGTVQWCWGLDDFHDTNDPGDLPPTTPDVRMQQATLNVLADMGVQPATKQSNLAPAMRSSDTLPPVTSVAAPAAGSAVPIGSQLTVSGTAADSGGGVTAAVEVSTDGGATWHPATGTSAWSYTYMPTLLGSNTIQVRSTDDSCNTENPPASLTFTGGPRAYPCSIWPAIVVPQVVDSGDPSPIEAGVKFRASAPGFATGVRFFKSAANTGTHVGTLWSSTGVKLATVTFTGESPSGWQQATFSRPVALQTATTYIVSVFMPSGRYSADSAYFNSAYDLAPLRALANGEDGANGVFRYGASGFPTSTYGATNYWVDVLFDTNNNQAPTVVSTSPAAGLQAVALASTVTATFSEAMTAGSVRMQIQPSGGAAVAGTTSYDATTLTATFTPSSPLTAGTTYTATVTGTDATNSPMASPYAWSFTTASAAGAYPRTLWDTAAVPAVASANDPSAVEVGVRFTSDVDGLISGIRFYKGPLNTGSHVGHLWTAAGTLLGTATFTNESVTGWQQANFTAPVQITKGAVYVASYSTSSGGYAVTSGYFASQYDNAPLRALAGGGSPGNGVYLYGPGGFPTASFGSANYWVDVVLDLATDSSPPAVIDESPAPGVQAVVPGSVVSATFSEPINPSTLVFNLNAGTAAVPGSVSLDPSRVVATFTPASPLSTSRTYTASVAASDVKGNAMPSPFTWTFTTVASGLSPATIWNSSAVPAMASVPEASSVEVGVRFRADADGAISGIRFYKGAANTGAHVGHLWSNTGTLLGSVPFANESRSGWQQANFANPIPVAGGVTYVASYFAPAGAYAVTSSGLSSAVDNGLLHALSSAASGGNGVFAYGNGAFPSNSYNASNYWVDVVYVDSVGPSVISRSPDAGATNVAISARVTVGFSEAVQPASVVFTLADGVGSQVNGSITTTSTGASFTPATPLAAGKAYTATVSGARDLAGNGMGAPVSWSFTTTSTSVVSIFPNGVPANSSVNDPSAVELGVKFQASVAGNALAVRFYKGSANTGTHVGNLWDASGTLLASVTFAGESATGWQQANFSSPVALSPNTTYVVSYLAPNGGYAANSGYFTAGDVVSGPLRALGSGSSGGNGVYRYGAGGGFPVSSYNATNYWVDLLFSAS